MQYKQILEAVVISPVLFHATSIQNAILILKSNCIKARTSHIGIGRGISLTNSWIMAQAWKPVIFVLDAHQIKMNYQTFPIKWRPNHGETEPGDEHETFVLGDILNLEDILVSINIPNPYVLKVKKNEISYYTNDIDRKKALDDITLLETNPKLNAW